jgi:cell wall-associated NlpC family hydrolase
MVQTVVPHRADPGFASGLTTLRIQILAALLSSAERWRGTPFQARARVCGAGVDCVQLAAALLEEAGLATGLEFPPYTVDFGDHADTSPVLAWFKARPEWTAVPAEDIAPGDVVLFRVGRVVNHVGVALGDQRFCHCLRGHGVPITDCQP